LWELIAIGVPLVSTCSVYLVLIFERGLSAGNTGCLLLIACAVFDFGQGYGCREFAFIGGKQTFARV
jgi:hypothetical protein